MAARSTSVASDDDYETQQKKQAAADVLFHYSQFVMVCIGEDVRPTDLRLHLMKVMRYRSSSKLVDGIVGQHIIDSTDQFVNCIIVLEVSGMPTSLKKETQQVPASPNSSGEPSSSGTMKGDKNESS